MSKQLGRTYIDRESYVNLGSPTTAQEWQDALLLPAVYGVLNVRHSIETKEYVVMLASERIPASETPVRITLIVACEQKDEHHATIFIDHLAFSNASGPIGEDKYDRESVPHKHVKLATSQEHATASTALSHHGNSSETTHGAIVASSGIVTPGYKTAPLPTGETVEPTRDTQFSGWAKASVQEMLEQRQGNYIDFNADDSDAVEEYSVILARHAYDLAKYVLSVAPQLASNDAIKTVEQALSCIPDLVGSPGKIYDKNGVWLGDE